MDRKLLASKQRYVLALAEALWSNPAESGLTTLAIALERAGLVLVSEAALNQLGADLQCACNVVEDEWDLVGSAWNRFVEAEVVTPELAAGTLPPAQLLADLDQQLRAALGVGDD